MLKWPALRWIILLLGVATGCGLLVACGKEKPDAAAKPPMGGFMPASHFPDRLARVAPERCLPCHHKAVEDWRLSHHAAANRAISEKLDAIRFTRPVTPPDSPYQPEAGTFRIEGPGIDPPPLGYSRGVIGITPLIQDLVTRPGGRWQAHELAYDPDAQEWFNMFNDENRQPGEWGHWSGQGMNWNSNCAWCHMTDYKRHYDPDTDSYDSQWLAHGLSCVQCHPRSLEHTDAAEAGQYIPADFRKNTPKVAMDTCAACHARRETLTNDAFVAGDNFYDHFRLTLPDAPNIYFNDRQNLDENYVFGSLMLSRMGHKGVTCADCHNPHSGENILPVQNNALCLRCHGTGENEATVIKPLEHSHHPAGSTGNQCIECHMPQRTYMGRDPRRDHGFISPDPELSQELGTPDVCSKCHDDHPLEWSIPYANEWYDSPQRDERRARARLLARAHSGEAPFPTAALQAAADATEEAYWKSTYIRLLCNSPEAPSLQAWARRFTGHEASHVRGAAVRLLGVGGAPNEEIGTFGQDPVREVRLEAIQILRGRNALPPTPVGDEAEYFAANADRPGTALQMAALALARGELAVAKRHIQRAASFDSSNPQVYFQAALVLDSGGHVDDALEFLRQTPEAARQTGLVHYAEGLLWAEKGDVAQTAARLRLAVERDPSQSRWWYNLALAYARMPNLAGARQAIGRALALDPRNPAYSQFAQQLQATAP